MNLRLSNCFTFILICLILSSCTSVEKYNEKISKPIAVAKLQKDINYTQHKLEKSYPNLYGYISKEQLNFKFDSIRKVVDMPMTTKEFYFVIAPVIASIRQGHMTMTPVTNKISKKDSKKYKYDGPISQFGFEWENGSFYIIKNKSNKRIALGTEVVSINGITPQFIYQKYRKTTTSDGFNETYIRKGFAKRFSMYMTNEIGIHDSLRYVFKQGDSLFTEVVSRKKAVPKVATSTTEKAKDSTIVSSKKPVDKVKNKQEKKKKSVYGYDYVTKEYVKSLRYLDADGKTAILRIKNFSDGKYSKAYAAIFDSLNVRKTQNLIIDIRDNPGGRVADAVTLYSYLTDKDYVLLEPAIVTSKTSLWKLGLFRNIPVVAYPFAAVFYPFYMGFSTLRTTKNQKGLYQYKLVGSRERKAAPTNFKGKIFVLINGGSFSASCILSASLKANPNVTFVGEETGGAFNGTVAGIMPVVKLPHSKIPLRLGLMDIKTKNQSEQLGRGIFPDIEIKQTVQDKIKKKDPEVEWILNSITSSEKL